MKTPWEDEMNLRLDFRESRVNNKVNTIDRDRGLRDVSSYHTLTRPRRSRFEDTGLNLRWLRGISEQPSVLEYTFLCFPQLGSGVYIQIRVQKPISNLTVTTTCSAYSPHTLTNIYVKFRPRPNLHSHRNQWWWIHRRQLSHPFIQ